MAERIGVGADAIVRWETGKREPSWGNVLALATALGVECTAFSQAPATDQPAPKRGRPRKLSPAAEAARDAAPAEVSPPAPAAENPTPKKSRGPARKPKGTD